MDDSAGRRAAAVRYATWVERVFGALGEAAGMSPLTGGVSLGVVAERLGLGSISWDDFAKHEEPSDAIMTAMDDLDALGLVTFSNVGHGNALTQHGRDVATLGFGEIREAAAGVPLSDDERALLARLYVASMLEGDGWADFAPVDTKPIEAELAGSDEYGDRLRLWTMLGDLRDKGLLRYRHSSCRPTYVAAVILAEPDPRFGGVRAGLIDWSVPTPGWEAIEDSIAALKVKLAAAASDEDLQDVSRRCRELAAEAVGVVFRPWMVPTGTEPPSPQDAEARLGHYIASEVKGEDLQEFRAFLRATLALAQGGTHSRRKARAVTLAACQGMLGFIRALQGFDRSRGSDQG